MIRFWGDLGFLEAALAAGQKHYLPNGKEYAGPTHKVGGQLMTGAKPAASSKKLSHAKPKAGKGK